MKKSDKKASKAPVSETKWYEFGRKTTLRSHIWVYFMAFVVAILLLLWLFQFFFLNSYYQAAKTKQIKSVAATIELSVMNEDVSAVAELIDKLAFENNMCIAITDKFANFKFVSDFMGGRSVITDQGGFRLFEYRNRLLYGSDDEIYEKQASDRFTKTELLYGKILGDTDYLIFISSSIEPVDSTAQIIKQQLIYITIIIFELAFIITMLLSKRLSAPIVKITESAKDFAKGNYSVRFEGSDYAEVEALSNTLNYAVKEVSKVDELRRDIISNTSHDLRTPLTMIKAYAEMIRDLSGDNPEKRNEHIGVIIDETDRLSALVNNILEISKLQSGAIQLEMSEFSIHEKLSEVMSRYKILSERDGYEFELKLDEDVICEGDQQKLEQVFYNLINNAVNYSGDSRRIIVRQINKPGFVRIEVTDFGKGIEKDKLPVIFDRYYRDEHTKRDVVGTGLGLSIVKEILKLHKFPFGVQSELGKGSTFWFEIRIKPDNKR